MSRSRPAPATGRHIEIIGETGQKIAGYLGTKIVPIRDKDHYEGSTRYFVVAVETMTPDRQRAIAERVAAANQWTLALAMETNHRNGVLVRASLARIVDPQELQPPSQTSFLVRSAPRD